MDAKTPGQVNYEAYWLVLAEAAPGSIEARWDLANSLHRAAWEAAAQAVLAMQEEERPRVIHLLMAGVPRCGFSQKAPVNWPAGHRWSAYREDVTCPACQAPTGAATAPADTSPPAPRPSR